MDEKQGIPENLRQKYPHLKPIKGPPSLLLVNGIGVGVVGKQDFDEETQTYIKTRCLCFVFIPVFAVDAYRVADAGSRRWYFLGKESIPPFWRSWNMAMGFLLLIGVLAIGWDIHTSSPAYIAGQEMKRAATLMQAGDSVKAAGVYRQQIHGPLAAEAIAGLKAALTASLQSDNPQNNAAALRLLSGVTERATLFPDAFNQGLARVEKFRATDPVAALDILHADAALDPKNPALPDLSIDLLKQVVAARPDDIDHLVELALIYETAGRLDDSLQILRPHKSSLGSTEGARMLGQKFLQEQNYSDAYALLFPYVQARLEKLHAVETAYSGTLAAISRRAVSDLNNGRGSPDFYSTYKTASKEQQDAMVDRYIEAQTKNDPTYQRALADLKGANQIVPVALDLGIVQLNRAQELQDVAARKTELEAAEKTFLAIRGFAGETDEYRLFLGQVYYWLGKSKEGRELFDQLLASRKREYSILMSIAQTLRAVGESKDARDMVDEAYKAATEDSQRYAAASMRAVLCKDEEERISWLLKADQTLPWIQIELNETRGRQALEKGNKPLAASFLNKAVAGYEAQPKTSASLNNWGLACFELYEATGDVAHQKHGLSLLEEAITIDPGNSILLHNTTYNLISLAAKDLNHDIVNLSALGEQAGIYLLSFLYQDEAGRTKVYQQLREDEAMKKALGYLDKALLLAPKNLSLYSTALAIHGGFRNLDELQKLQQRFSIAALDLTEPRKEMLAAYKGEKDKEDLENLNRRMLLFSGFATNPAIASDAATLEYVNVTLDDLKEESWIYGADVDGRELLQNALATYQKHPSAASHGTLESAYFFRANEELAQASPDYAAQSARCRHLLGTKYFIGLILERNGPLAGLVRKNENVIRGLALEKETVANYPGWSSISQWALLRDSAPDVAATAAARLKDNKVARLMDDLQFQFSPVGASYVLEQYWTQKMLGDEKRANEIYQTALHDGVPLPPL